jgi:hypothetical protein
VTTEWFGLPACPFPLPARQIWVTIAAKLNWDIVKLNTAKAE